MTHSALDVKLDGVDVRVLGEQARDGDARDRNRPQPLCPLVVVVTL